MGVKPTDREKDKASAAPGRSRRLRGIVLFGALSAAILWFVYQASEYYFLDESADQGRAALSLHVENFEGWLSRYKALPRIYSKSAEITEFLEDRENPALRARANQYLVDGNLASGASDTYVLDTTGTALVASNWDDEKSFVDKNYSFRPYYQQAMQGRLGRFFGLGTVSGKRGYYFSHPVRDGSEIVGVVVVKVGVDAIEEDLKNSAQDVLVSNDDGVVVLAGNPDWRLRTLRGVEPAALDRIRRNRQFDAERLAQIDWQSVTESPTGTPLVSAETPRSGQISRRYLVVSEFMPTEGWTAHLLVATDTAARQTWIVVVLAAVGLIAIGLIVAVIRERRKRLEDRLAANKQAHDRLERAVAQRTVDLSDANRKLEAEVGERRAAEEELTRTQAELVQAGKLAALGQMSAALSHEFNQPLAAIRTYADNAIALLERGREEDAQANIRLVSSLTERMAELSKHLSSFARKPQDKPRAVSLTGALTETLSLLQGRLDQLGLEPEIDVPEDEVWVVGGHIRIQQVIMNLVSNAIDAMRDQSDPRLTIAIHQTPDHVCLIVEDGGPGIDPNVLGQIFDPFFTTKGVGKGLGLGLSISFNIIKDFGGSITAENRPDGGARFVVTLKPAEAMGEFAAE